MCDLRGFTGSDIIYSGSDIIVSGSEIVSGWESTPVTTHLRVARRDILVGTTFLIVWMSRSRLDEIHVPRDDEGEELFASPHRLGLEDSRERHLPVPSRKPHQ